MIAPRVTTHHPGEIGDILLADVLTELVQMGAVAWGDPVDPGRHSDFEAGGSDDAHPMQLASVELTPFGVSLGEGRGHVPLRPGRIGGIELLSAQGAWTVEDHRGFQPELSR